MKMLKIEILKKDFDGFKSYAGVQSSSFDGKEDLK